MRHRDSNWAACGMAVLVAFGINEATAGDWDWNRRDTLPEHYSGLLNDHTPSAAVVKGGPYEMRGKWQLQVDERRGTGKFTAEMDMSTSDYGITQGTVDKDNPATRGAHTHHISMTDGVLTLDWPARCPQFAPAVKEGFAITGTAFVTGNGSPAPFGNPTPFTVCILGGDAVKFANMTMTFGTPAASHFGTQPIHGVVLWCAGRFLRPSSDCSLEE
jgi:hypothetical protein